MRVFDGKQTPVGPLRGPNRAILLRPVVWMKILTEPSPAMDVFSNTLYTTNGNSDIALKMRRVLESG